MCLLGLSTTTPDGWTNRPLVYASPDGIDWHFLSFITPAIEGGSAVSDRAGPDHLRRDPPFLHAALALRDGRILASVRFQRDATRRHLDRHLRERRRRAHVALPLARQRLGRARRHRRDARTAASSASTAIGSRRPASAPASARTAAGPGARSSSCATTAAAGTWAIRASSRSRPAASSPSTT